MRLVFIYLLIILAFRANSQVWLTEDFNTPEFPPPGWTIDNHAENWSYSPSNHAGGGSGEAVMRTFPKFAGTSRFISPVSNVSGSVNMTLYFKYTLSIYAKDFVIGVAVKYAGNDWTSIWERDAGTAIKKELDLPIDIPENTTDLQFCFYFTGPVEQLKYWAVDEIMLYDKKEHDVAAITVMSDIYYQPGDQFVPEGKFYNNGTNTETFNVNCNVYDTVNNILFTITKTIDTLEPGAYKTVAFDTITLPETPDNAYRITVSTALEDDMVPGNDTADKYVYTYVSYPHDYILFEMGTATWCSVCPYATHAAEDMLTNGLNLAVIEYHSNDDYATEATEIRTQDYYSMLGFPTVYFDGVLKQLGAGPGIYSKYLYLYDQRSEARTGVSLSLLHVASKEGFIVRVTISKQAPAFNPHTALHLVITESHIPENWQTETELNFVCRMMLPDVNGTLINLGDQNEFNLDYTISPDSSWNFDNLEVVAFLQDIETYEILNVTKQKLSELTTVGEIARFSKTDQNGNQQWTKTYGDANMDAAYSVEKTSDGGYVIAGSTHNSMDVYVIKTDVNGDSLWTRSFGGPATDEAYSVQQTNNGGYIITGKTQSYGAGDYDVWLIKLDENGDSVWSKTYGGESRDIGWSVIQTNDGGYYITGYTESYAHAEEDSDMWLIRTDENGDTLWTKSFGGYSDDGGQWGIQTDDNDFVSCGYEYISGQQLNFYLVRLTYDGVGISEITPGSSTVNVYPNPVKDRATIVFDNPDGNIYNLSVIDITGKTVISKKNITGKTVKIEKGNLPGGLYFIQLKGEKTFVGKVVFD